MLQIHVKKSSTHTYDAIAFSAAVFLSFDKLLKTPEPTVQEGISMVPYKYLSDV